MADLAIARRWATAFLDIAADDGNIDGLGAELAAVEEAFRGAGLEPFHLEPHVIAGGPESDAARWMGAFFPFHTEGWVEDGLLTAGERDRFLAEWEERRADPDALFYSPIVVGAAARKPA